MTESTDLLKIAVTFKGAKNQIGLTEFGEQLTSSNINDFIPNPSDIQVATALFEQNGFEISGQSDLSITLRGNRQNFERFFNTRLSEWTLSCRKGLIGGEKFLYPAPNLERGENKELKTVIDESYIQWPFLYMDQRFDANGPSLYPPNKDYHHLRVPGDLVLSLNAAKAHRRGFTGRGVRVAMIDSGFNFSHPYYQESGYKTEVHLAFGATEPLCDGKGHGTAMSANLLAIAPDIHFIGIKLNNEYEKKKSASLIEGFKEALKHNPDIITISAGSNLVKGAGILSDLADNPDHHLTSLPNNLKALEGDILKAIEQGITVVCAAGNGEVAFPAMMPEVIAVGGVYINGKGRMQASDYASSYISRIYPGRHVPDFCGLVGLKKNNASYIMLPFQPLCDLELNHFDKDKNLANDGWATYSGTSAAAPQIAGVCALLLQKNDGLSPARIKEILSHSCRQVTIGHANPESNQGEGRKAGNVLDCATGRGLVDAFAALQQV